MLHSCPNGQDLSHFFNDLSVQNPQNYRVPASNLCSNLPVCKKVVFILKFHLLSCQKVIIIVVGKVLDFHFTVHSNPQHGEFSLLVVCAGRSA